MHAFDMCGGMSEEKKGDGAVHHGGDQIIDELCLADLEELWQRVANLGKDGVVEESSEANLWGVRVPKQEVEALNGGRRGPTLTVLGNWCISVLDEGSSEEEESGESWVWVYWS